ncbi:hypothetical protein [Oceanobacillus sp. FSL K6-0251]|uniref:hypothetical protein n=1 Tax=Oceanobacillus sp. FSL K6-0251 TaxID=2921602 RepID=UPI0030F8599B
MESSDALKENLQSFSSEYNMITVERKDLVNVLHEHRELTKYIETFHILSLFYNDCLKFWKNEGNGNESQDASFKAFKDVCKLVFNPYVSVGERLDVMAISKWTEIKGEELSLEYIY